jgi:Rps23 Pro-64 3,4-dihydroxylase Tpa1-like proline 4-hydroxylase
MLNKVLNVDAIKNAYRNSQRVVITDIFDSASANAVHRSLCAHREWDLCSYGPYADGAFSKSSIDDSVDNDAYKVIKDTNQSDEYSFRYYGYSLHKRTNAGLSAFLDYISSSREFTDFISEVTGDNTFNYVSPQATYFDAGCFLRTHNDFHQVNGVQTRKVAFVFGYTKGWAADWGGTFHVLNNEGVIIDSICPGFNNLTLFKVPTIHYVSPVAHYAIQRRYAISGWFMNNPRV